VARGPLDPAGLTHQVPDRRAVHRRVPRDELGQRGVALREQAVAPLLHLVQPGNLQRVGGAVLGQGRVEHGRPLRIGGQQLAEVADVPGPRRRRWNAPALPDRLRERLVQGKAVDAPGRGLEGTARQVLQGLVLAFAGRLAGRLGPIIGALGGLTLARTHGSASQWATRSCRRDAPRKSLTSR